MCHYVSFAISADGSQIIRGKYLDSHAWIQTRRNKLKADEYREAEWVGETRKDLTIRTHYLDKHQTWYKAAILGIAKNRTALLEKIMMPGEKTRLKVIALIQKSKIHPSDWQKTSFLARSHSMQIPMGWRCPCSKEKDKEKITELNKKLRKLGYRLARDDVQWVCRQLPKLPTAAKAAIRDRK